MTRGQFRRRCIGMLWDYLWFKCLSGFSTLWTIVGGVVAVARPEWVNVSNVLAFSVPIGLTVIVFTVGFLAASYNVYEKELEEAKQERLRLESELRSVRSELESIQRGQPLAKLQLFFDKAKHRRVGHSGEVMYRVGIRERDGRPIGGVSVRLKSIRLASSLPSHERANVKDRLTRLFDLPLLLMHDREQPRKRQFDLAAGATEDVDVMGESPRKDFLSICHAIAINPPYAVLPIASYRLTITATAQGAEKDEQEFLLRRTRKGRITFCPK
jgi:hypothetical protein